MSLIEIMVTTVPFKSPILISLAPRKQILMPLEYSSLFSTRNTSTSQEASESQSKVFLIKKLFISLNFAYLQASNVSISECFTICITVLSIIWKYEFQFQAVSFLAPHLNNNRGQTTVLAPQHSLPETYEAARIYPIAPATQEAAPPRSPKERKPRSVP